MRRSIALLLSLAVAGCGRQPAPKNAFVPIAEIDPALVKKAQAELPGVKFDSARKIQVYGQDAYEIRGKAANGKIREVEVTAAGEVLEVE